MSSEILSVDDLPQEGMGAQKIQVLVFDPDTPYLVDLVDRLERDAKELEVRTTTHVRQTIDLLRSGAVDCLLITYDPASPEGIEIFEYLREHPVDVPVVLLPGERASIIDSRNLAVDIASVFDRTEGLEDGVLAPHLVYLVEQNRIANRADRRAAVKEMVHGISLGIATANTPEAIDQHVCDQIYETPAYDAGWMAHVDDEREHVTPAVVSASDPSSVPGLDRDGIEGTLIEAARRAMRYDRPQVARLGDTSYGLIPIHVEQARDRALGLASDSKYAFHEAELDILSEIGQTLARTFESTTQRRDPEEQVGRIDLFERIVKGLGIGVVVYDRQGRIQQVNRRLADLVDRELDVVAEEMVWNVVPGVTLSSFDERWEELRERETASHKVVRGTRTGREFELVSTHVSVGGRPYVVAVLLETERDGASGKEFADLLGYEFNHWLEMADRALEQIDQGDHEKVQLVEEIIERMRETVELEVGTSSVEDLTEPRAKRDEGETRVKPHSDLQGLGEVAGTAWRHVLGKTGEYEIHSSHAVKGDRGLLIRLFEHLIRTLLHYVDGSSSVNFGLLDDGFYVEDQGTGTPHAERAYADGFTRGSGVGEIGAGIRVGKRIADRLGWTLTMTENDAGGTRFEITDAEVVPIDDADRGGRHNL